MWLGVLLTTALVFGAIVVGLFVSGLTESRVMGFTGLSRLLVTYLQITMALLPLFATKDFREALTAYMEKRPAHFEGQ